MNWACEICGRVFGRSFSAKRHVWLKHHGYGNVIDYPSYLYRVNSGFLRPPELKTGRSRRSVSTYEKIMDKVNDEIENRIVKYYADQITSPGNNDSSNVMDNIAKIERINAIRDAFKKKREERRSKEEKINPPDIEAEVERYYTVLDAFEKKREESRNKEEKINPPDTEVEKELMNNYMKAFEKMEEESRNKEEKIWNKEKI